jgi:hypothetical protein
MMEQTTTNPLQGSMRRRFREMNRPPEGESWLWMTSGMLESPAWRTLPGHALKLVMRIALEHLSHGGLDNGALPVTYGDFVKFGIERRRIREAIMIAEGLGFIERVSVGETPWHGHIRTPGKFALTWLPKANGIPPSNKWTRHTTIADANAAILYAQRTCEKLRKLPAAFNRQAARKKGIAAKPHRLTIVS